MNPFGDALHRNHRIHSSRLFSGVWVVSIVAPGGKVEHLRGEFPSQAQALEAATRHIDSEFHTTTGKEDGSVE